MPCIVLSHWDSDHWSSATLDKRLLRMTWVVPRQEISPHHIAFANEILSAGGRILVVPSTQGVFSFTGLGQTLQLRRCTGADRNGSGLALIIADHNSQQEWLLTGDASYDFIPGPLPSNLVAVVVPHHGADMGSRTAPHPSVPYARLLYSFGPGNAHGRTNISHPTSAAVFAHESNGWSHGAWLPPPHAMRLAGPPVLATASHLTTHENGAIVSWTGPPSPILTGHIAACPDVMPINQT
jgi:hypothetical protein